MYPQLIAQQSTSIAYPAHPTFAFLVSQDNNIVASGFASNSRHLSAAASAAVLGIQASSPPITHPSSSHTTNYPHSFPYENTPPSHLLTFHLHTLHSPHLPLITLLPPPPPPPTSPPSPNQVGANLTPAYSHMTGLAPCIKTWPPSYTPTPTHLPSPPNAPPSKPGEMLVTPPSLASGQKDRSCLSLTLQSPLHSCWAHCRSNNAVHPQLHCRWVSNTALAGTTPSAFALRWEITRYVHAPSHPLTHRNRVLQGFQWLPPVSRPGDEPCCSPRHTSVDLHPGG